MGVALHANASTTDISDTAAFEKLVRGATQLIYNKASSGLYAAKLLEKLGLKDGLRSKTVVVDSGEAIMEAVAAQAPRPSSWRRCPRSWC